MKFDKNTKILIVGLGLIGGSYAKALSDEGYFVGAIDKKNGRVRVEKRADTGWRDKREKRFRKRL